MKKSLGAPAWSAGGWGARGRLAGLPRGALDQGGGCQGQHSGSYPQRDRSSVDFSPHPASQYFHMIPTCKARESFKSGCNRKKSLSRS